jgi:hypothetical protein
MRPLFHFENTLRGAVTSLHHTSLEHATYLSTDTTISSIFAVINTNMGAEKFLFVDVTQ